MAFQKLITKYKKKCFQYKKLQYKKSTKLKKININYKQ